MKSRSGIAPVISIMLTVAIIASIPPAIDIVAGNAINPDHGFVYSLEKIGEKEIELVFGLNPPAKINFLLKCGEERLVELNQTKEKLTAEGVRMLCEEYEACINASIAEASRLGREDLIELVAERTKYHQSILEDVKEKVPEQAKPWIEHALGVSMHGHETCQKALRREIPISEVEREFKKPRKG